MALALAQATTVAAGVGVSTLLARGLGVEGYGQYVFALAIVQFMLVPLDFGLPTLVMREIAVLRSRCEWQLVWGLLRWSVGVVWVVLLTVGLGVAVWQGIEDGNAALFAFAVGLAGVWAFMRLASGVLRGMERVVWAALPDQVIRPLTLLGALIVLLVAVELTPARAMAAHALAAVVGLGWALWMLGWRSPPIPRGMTLNAEYAPRVWLRSLLPLGLQVGADFLNTRIDILMLGGLTGSREVGLYGLAVLIGGIVGMPETLIKNMVAPRIAKLHEKGNISEIQRIAGLAALVSVAGAVGAFVGILVFGELVVKSLVGSEFVPSVGIAGVVAIGSIVTAAWCSAAPVLNMTGNERFTAQISWASAVLNATFNLALIPVLGALGAAIATAIVTAGRQVAFSVVAKRRTGIDTGPRSLLRTQVTK